MGNRDIARWDIARWDIAGSDTVGDERRVPERYRRRQLLGSRGVPSVTGLGKPLLVPAVALLWLACNASRSSLPGGPDADTAGQTKSDSTSGQPDPSTTGQGSTGDTGADPTGTSVGGAANANADATVTTGGPSSLTDVPIPYIDGWVSGRDNSVGIQGGFYAFTDADDGGTSAIEPTSFVSAGTEICVQGTAGQVMTGDFGSYWGAAIGLNLLQEEGTDRGLPFDAAAAGIVGFGFVVEGDDPLPATGELRFTVKVAGDYNSYCSNVPVTGINTFYLTEMWQSCWENDATAPTPDPERLEALHWQYVTNADASYDFSLCISRLFVLLG